MPVVKGGVWTNVEDEVLKAAVSKYGLNQWARVSSLLARKTPKQCKARWNEWLDPGIRKVEWSKEEDEKLLHLAKLLPQQWKTVGPIVGRTANQSLQRYQQLLDDAEARESSELGLAGPGDEALAPSADSVRRLRPGELDPDPESKPARPDTIDLDEDEKEMLSEARARLANTQGKKAKRKARERQLEESRRLALLQKRRELKNAGINIKINNRKKGQMDYNADIPFEKPPVPGFHDTKEEIERNDREREKYDPRKQQLAIKRKGEQDEDSTTNKKQKGEKDGPSAGLAAAMKAGQMQKIREAEQNSKRRALVLPAPQVGESELEDIVKMGMAGERAGELARQGGDNTRSLVGSYSNVVGEHSGPIRTPRAPPQEDYIANQIRDIKAMTETRSSLLGGENTPLHEGTSTSGDRAKAGGSIVTPNPLATPYRQMNGISSTPLQKGVPGATPLRTPRDNLSLNQDGHSSMLGATPREIKLQERTVKTQLRSQLAALPKPKMTEWELELPEEQKATTEDTVVEEDATERDRQSAAARKAREEAKFKRRSQVVQKGLPVIPMSSLSALRKRISSTDDPNEVAIYEEMIQLITEDNTPGRKSKHLGDEEVSQARLEVQRELASLEIPPVPPIELSPLDAAIFPQFYNSIEQLAEKNNAIEKKLALHLGGYQQRAKSLRQKIAEAAETLEATKLRVDVARTAQIAEDATIASRLKQLREEVMVVNKRERETQEKYRTRKEELESLGVTLTNGVH